MGLIIAVIVLLAAGGGIAAVVLLGKGDSKQAGSGSGSQLAINDHGSGSDHVTPIDPGSGAGHRVRSCADDGGLRSHRQRHQPDRQQRRQ